MTAATQNKACPHCGGFHAAKCPLVKSIEYYENGNIKRIEFHAPQPFASGDKSIFEHVFGR